MIAPRTTADVIRCRSCGAVRHQCRWCGAIGDGELPSRFCGECRALLSTTGSD